MEARRLGGTLLKIACLYMTLGLLVGMFVGLTGRFAFISVHSHISLLGWTTMAIAGLVYLAFPACAGNWLARAHFWLHNVGLPIMLVSLVLKAAGNDQVEPLVGIGSTAVLLGLALFTVNVFRNAVPRAA